MAQPMTPAPMIQTEVPELEEDDDIYKSYYNFCRAARTGLKSTARIIPLSPASKSAFPEG